MTRSGASDHIAIEALDEEVTWQREERPIARGIKAVEAALEIARGTPCRNGGRP